MCCCAGSEFFHSWQIRPRPIESGELFSSAPLHRVVIGAGAWKRGYVDLVAGQIDAFVAALGGGSRDEIADLCIVYVEFFGYFSGQRLLRSFARFYFSAGKFPLATFGLVWVAPASENPALVLNHSADDSDDFHHVLRLCQRSTNVVPDQDCIIGVNYPATRGRVN